MSPRIQRTRPSNWHSTGPGISTVISSTSTIDPLRSAMTVPMPTLELVFGGTADGELLLIRAEMPLRIAALPSGLADAAEPAYCSIDPIDAAFGYANRIELSIDSLPNYVLIQPIPVTIEPVGDTTFTAWVQNLETNATGQSVIEALLLLKGRIELVYGELSQRSHLDVEQKMTLQILHDYIAPKKPEWI